MLRGFSGRQGRPRRFVNHDELRRLRSEGASLRQIAAKLSVGYGTVRLRLRKAEISNERELITSEPTIRTEYPFASHN